MTFLHSSSGYSSILTLGPSRPALLTRTSIPPKRSTVSLTILSTSAPFDTSAARARTSAPVSSTSSATGPMDPSLRALIATLAPSLAKACASALPRPWLAPVMSVTLSSSMFLPFGSISASQHVGSRRPNPWLTGYLTSSATKRCTPHQLRMLRFLNFVTLYRHQTTSSQLHLYLLHQPADTGTLGMIPKCHEEAQPFAKHAVGGSPLLRQAVCLSTPGT